eukprot:TRINITY_DN16797_c0_g1_i1.p1 TRINITY_DN16797_c0_g1~~TRINITY_DN16797_c0_g1_i1.p1  ORF type:complete len:105 (-),score=20.85 TRINITY_DN16797_c0_g1_i1:304-618(-)
MWFFNRNSSEERAVPTEDAATAIAAGGGDIRDGDVERKDIAQPRVHYAKPVPKLRKKLELSTDDDRGSTPSRMWQVYALAGFMIGRWVWARVKERRVRKGDAEE